MKLNESNMSKCQTQSTFNRHSLERNRRKDEVMNRNNISRSLAIRLKAEKIIYPPFCKSKMPLIGIPDLINPELLYALAKAGHGDKIVIADANFPSDTIAATATITNPIRVQGSTSDVLRDILKLLPLDQYMTHPIAVMDRVESDKKRGLEVPAYEAFATVTNKYIDDLEYVERFDFYEKAKGAFVVIQTNDKTLYANAIIYKGVI